MLLRDFVKNALVDVVEGIRSAQTEECCANLIAPKALMGSHHGFEPGSGIAVSYTGGEEYGTVVKFDVAVTSSDSTSINAEGKARLLVVGGHVDGKYEKNNATVNRISFSVPVGFPGASK
jgi:hypothetical protein